MNGKNLPLLILFLCFVADILATVTAIFLFSISTHLHLSSKDFIKISVNETKGRSGLHSKFWKGMKPIKIHVGQVCSFETREFLLFIWGEVVIAKLIDFLIAF